jgi:hypothetical protein
MIDTTGIVVGEEILLDKGELLLLVLLSLFDAAIVVVVVAVGVAIEELITSLLVVS